MSRSRPSKYSTPIALTTLLGIVPLSVNADGTETNQIEEIVVEAFRLPTEVTKTGSSIFVLDQAQLKQRGHIYVTDALMTVPGVTVNQNGPFGGQATARIRGASSGQTLVMIDGIVINDASSVSGAFDFGSVELSDIEKVEVLKGPQSTLWGSDAIGGVINIVSKAPGQELSGEVGSTIGSFGTTQYRGVLSGGNELGDFRINLSDTNTDGISKADEDDGNSEDDGYDAQTISAVLGINLPGNSRLQINHRETETETEFDSFSFSSASGVADGDELSEVERSTTQVRLTVPALDGRLVNTLVYAQSETERTNFTNGVFGFSAQGERDVLQYQGTFKVNDSQTFSFGYEDESSSSSSNDADIDGVYALYQLSPIENLTVSMGVRRDDHSDFGEETVGRISAAWEATDDLNIQASWGEGFKAPSIFQTTFFCCGATEPNPDLQAETSEAFDIGFTWQFNNRGSIGLTYFTQETENQIDFNFGIGGYENIAKVDSDGFELALNYRITDNLSAIANVTHLSSEDGDGNELVRIPELTGDLSLNWQATEDLSATLAVVYNDEEEDSRGTVDDWARVDVSGTWSPSEVVEVFARLENLTNRDYQQIFGYGTPERSAYLGLNYRF